MDDPADPQRAQPDRLDSWKRIAVYLKRDVSTVQRWERREGMPVHRHLHAKQGSVFAYAAELDVWWKSRRKQLGPEPPDAGDTPAADVRPWETDSAPVSGPIRFWPPGRGAVAVASILLAAALGWLIIDRAFAWRNPLAGAKFSRLSEFAESGQAAAISPNGKYMAFLASRDRQIDAWVGEIGSGDYRNLTRGSLPSLVNPSIRTLGFSADSAFTSVWSRNGDGTHPGDVSIYVAPTAGGPLRPYMPDVAEYDWSRDGRRLVYHTTAPGDPLFVRERDGAESHQIYAASAGVHCHFPVWSTDASFIYFVRGVPPDDWDVWRIRPSGMGLERVTHHNGRVTYPVMLDRRTLIYLVTDADGAGPWIYGLDIERPVPHRLTSGLEIYTSLAASADGMRLIATTANPHSSLWRIRLVPDQVNAEAPTFMAANALTPRLGRDILVYVSSRNGSQGIWTYTQGATREVWRSAGLRIKGAPALSPDGSHIAFTVTDGAHARLLEMDQHGSHVTVLTDSLQLLGDPVWSPDGQSVVSAVGYQGEPRLTRIFLNGRPPMALLGEYSVDPIWAPDGRFLVYSGRDIGTTFPVRAAAADGRPYDIPGLLLTRGARRLVFARDSSALLVLRGDIAHKDIWRVDLHGGGARQLTSLPRDFIVNDFDISADGSALILDKLDNNSDMALIERSKNVLSLSE